MPRSQNSRPWLGPEQAGYFKALGVPPALLEEMRIGYNGRYVVYPYILENGNCYAARCILPGREEDSFWHGNEAFFARDFRIYNVEEIERCEGGALIVTEGENSLLALKGLGYPCIAVPSAADLEALTPERLGGVRDILLLLAHTPEARLCARMLATRLGYKVRILEWDHHLKPGITPSRLAADTGHGFRQIGCCHDSGFEGVFPFPLARKGASADQRHAADGQGQKAARFRVRVCKDGPRPGRHPRHQYHGRATQGRQVLFFHADFDRDGPAQNPGHLLRF